MSGKATSANPVVKPEVKQETSWWETGLDWFQVGLDVAVLIPGVGEIADGANALIYTARGDYVNAGLSAAAMIPFGGWAATGTKIGMKGAKAVGKEVVEEGVEKLTKEVGEKATKESAEKAAKEAAEKKAQQEAKQQAAKKADDAPNAKEKNKIKKQKYKKNCGKFGKYKDTQKYSAGEGRSHPERLQVDHVPSKRALEVAAIEKFTKINGNPPGASQRKFLKSMI